LFPWKENNRIGHEKKQNKTALPTEPEDGGLIRGDNYTLGV
jgi:hypothetical protein